MASDRPGLLKDAQAFESLDQVFRWAASQSPRVLADDVVIQDEYTHDVLFRAAEDAYVVFDAT